LRCSKRFYQDYFRVNRPCDLATSLPSSEKKIADGLFPDPFVVEFLSLRGAEKMEGLAWADVATR
jgi:hypothetical protein